MVRDQAKQLNTPPLQGRGRGWGLSTSTVEELQSRSRQMRNNPTEPEKRLWRRLSNGQLEGHKFRRQQVIGWHIADFACSSAMLIVEVDGDTPEGVEDRARDNELDEKGYRTGRINTLDGIANISGVSRTRWRGGG